MPALVLDYCICVWNSTYSTFSDKLESVQSFATKLLTPQLLSWTGLVAASDKKPC